MAEPTVDWDVTPWRHAADDLEYHLQTCPVCSAGHACPEGDDLAEHEYRVSEEMKQYGWPGRYDDTVYEDGL